MGRLRADGTCVHDHAVIRVCPARASDGHFVQPYPLRWTRLDDLQPKENGVCQAPRTTEARELKAYVDDEALSPGEIVGNGYVLQELLQGLGKTRQQTALVVSP